MCMRTEKLDLRSGSQRNRHFVGIFNVPVQVLTQFLLPVCFVPVEIISYVFFSCTADVVSRAVESVKR